MSRSPFRWSPEIDLVRCYGAVALSFRSHRSALVGLVLSLGDVVGCGRTTTEPAPAVTTAYRVRLEALRTRSGGSRVDDRSWQQDTVESALRGASMFSIGTEDDALDVAAEVLEVRTSGGIVVRLSLRMDVPPDLTGVLDELEAVVEVARAQGNSAIRADLPAAAERAVAVLDAKLRLARTPSASLSLLADEDSELVLIALDWVQQQRDRAAAETVSGLLSHADERVALRAIEVLGQIGGPPQVVSLISAARLSDRAHTGRLYEALAMLGGPDAEGFLRFAARNEDDPALARVAERALDQARLAEPVPPDAPVSSAPPVRGHR